MELTKKLELLENAYTYDKEKEQYFSNTELYTELEPIKKIQFEMDEGVKFELGYEIMNDACNYITENITIENLQNPDFDFREDTEANLTEFASIYTQTRLEYLNQWNQDEITDILKDYSCDIQTACAIWYDRQVEEAITKLIEWLQEK